MIFDTNVLIYLSKYTLKSERILVGNVAISVITKIETLGFPFKDHREYDLLVAICDKLKTIPLTDLIVEETIKLRKRYRIKLPDAVIYCTALVENVPLLTNNVKDFQHLGGNVELVNPLDL